MINCLEAVARLHLYVDRELTVEEVEIVQQHLSNCPSCECRFHFDLKVRRLLHEKCTIDGAPEHLRIAVMRLIYTSKASQAPLDPEIEQQIRADITSPFNDSIAE